MNGLKAKNFADGCHRYGWIIAIVIQLITVGYLSGVQTQKIQDVKENVQELKSDLGARIGRIESLMLNTPR